MNNAKGNNNSFDMNQEDIMGSDDEVEPEPTSPEIRARRKELLVKAHSAILKACWGSSSRAPKNMNVVWSCFC